MPLTRCVALSLLAAAGAATRSVAQDVVRIPMRGSAGPTTPGVTLEGFVYKPVGSGQFPLVVVSHGSANGEPRRSEPATAIAEYYVRHGFAVVVPMRKGRGRSDGISLESEAKNCDLASWSPGIASAFDDLTAALDYAWRLPFIDSTRTLLAGISRGGFLSVAYAAEGPRRAHVIGVVNFVGAWVAQAEDRCARDFNYLSFARFGGETKIPMLWLYGDGDRFNSTTSIRRYTEVFQARGGKVHFTLVSGVPENGHWLPRYSDLWRAPSDAYLASLGFHGR